MKNLHFPREKLEQALQAALTNEYSDFYRRHLSHIKDAQGNLTLSEWRALPLVRRDDVVSVPFWDRVHVPHEEVQYIRNTYGTSGKRILVTPRALYGSFEQNPYDAQSVTSVINFIASAHNGFPRDVIKSDTQLFFGDVGHLAMSARIIRQSKVDMLYILPYTALAIADYLDAEGVTQHIKVVQLCGERCSPLQFKKLKERYPNATVYGYYGQSETRELLSVACEHDRARGGSLIVEVLAPEFYMELVDTNTGEVVEEYGAYGEVVFTTLVPHVPFPLVRYATGDIARYVKRDCSCEEKRPGFEIIGRGTSEPIRMVKGELTLDAVENSLVDISAVSPEYFEVHYREQETDMNALPQVEIKVVAAGSTAPDMEIVRNTLENTLRVFPTYTYANGVRDGIYLPLSVSLLDAAPPSPAGKPKAPVIVRHT